MTRVSAAGIPGCSSGTQPAVKSPRCGQSGRGPDQSRSSACPAEHGCLRLQPGEHATDAPARIPGSVPAGRVPPINPKNPAMSAAFLSSSAAFLSSSRASASLRPLCGDGHRDPASREPFAELRETGDGETEVEADPADDWLPASSVGGERLFGTEYPDTQLVRESLAHRTREARQHHN
jgi:hypothetical protein